MCCSQAILTQHKSRELNAQLMSGLNYFSTPCGNKIHDMKQLTPRPPPPHLSMTARHSFLQVKRLPRRRRKVPGAVVMGGGVCRHSISSIAKGAGRMFKVAPKIKGKTVDFFDQFQLEKKKISQTSIRNRI